MYIITMCRFDGVAEFVWLTVSVLDPGPRTPDTGPRTRDPGHWTLDPGPFCLCTLLACQVRAAIGSSEYLVAGAVRYLVQYGTLLLH